MSFLHTSYTMHQESTIPLPSPPPSSTITPHQIAQLGQRVALALLHDAPAMIRLNPLVTGLSELPATDPHAVDHAALSLAFTEADTVTADAMCQPWRQYEIHDDLPLPFGYKKELVYYSAIRGLPGGFEGFTNPGSGVEIYGAWRVGVERVRYVVEDDGAGAQQGGKKKEESEGQWETVLLVEELGEVHANWFLAQYIKMTYPSSHKVMHARFKDEWEKRMKMEMAGQ